MSCPFWPISHVERIWKVYAKVLSAAVTLSNSSGGLIRLGAAPELIIDTSTGEINAYADGSKNQVTIFLNLAELISDSESELAFVVAHEVGHIIQNQNGRLIINTANLEWDADLVGMLLTLIAGYDPYAAAGALAKLPMASGTAGLVNQNFDNLLVGAGVDPHGSFNDRIALLFEEMQLICGLPTAQSYCSTYKSVVHPHLPWNAPLAEPAKPGIK